MNVLSLWEPWASLLIHGYKQFETRSWQTNIRGQISIHAAKRFDREQKKICLSEPFYPVLHQAGIIDESGNIHFTLGAVLGTVDLVDMWQTGGNGTIRLLGSNQVRRISETEINYGDYSKGRFAWETANPRRFDTPIITNGHQGLWLWEPRNFPTS